MDLFKLDKYDKYFIAFILVIITLFNIGQCFAAEEWEEVETTTVQGINVSSNSNYFYSSPNNIIRYFNIETGYIYKIEVIKDLSSSRYLVGSSELPALNVPYNLLTSDLQHLGDTYTFIANGSNYAFLSYSPNADSSGITVSRQKIAGQSSAINDLVDNVGVNQLWGVFEGGIDFVGVIVLVAFGLFLVFLLIKKLSKGKADF